jgi:hypothetical protein
MADRIARLILRAFQGAGRNFRRDSRSRAANGFRERAAEDSLRPPLTIWTQCAQTPVNKNGLAGDCRSGRSQKKCGFGALGNGGEPL